MYLQRYGEQSLFNNLRSLYFYFRLNKAIDEVAKSCQNENNNRHSPLLDKQIEMNELYSSVELTAQDKQNQLHDVLKEVCACCCCCSP